MDFLKRVEHNRWCTEKLLSGFRPLSKSEKADYMKLSEKERSDRKEELKKLPTRAHVDLSSYDEVAVMDAGTLQNDINLIMAIPKIVFPPSR